MREKRWRATRSKDQDRDEADTGALDLGPVERLVGAGIRSDDEKSVRQDAYEAWAQRLRTHKEDKLADIGGSENLRGRSTAEAESHAEPEQADNWRPAMPVAGGPDLALLQPNEMTNQELLASLGLSAAATDKEIQRTYRRLVMEHHPDRWQIADESTRQDHEDKLLRVTALRNELHSRGR